MIPMQPGPLAVPPAPGTVPRPAPPMIPPAGPATAMPGGDAALAAIVARQPPMPAPAPGAIAPAMAPPAPAGGIFPTAAAPVDPATGVPSSIARPPPSPAATYTPGVAFSPTDPATPRAPIMGDAAKERARLARAKTVTPPDPRGPAAVGAPAPPTTTPAGASVGVGKPAAPQQSLQGSLERLRAQQKRFEADMGALGEQRASIADQQADAAVKEAGAKQAMMGAQADILRAYGDETRELERLRAAAENRRIADIRKSEQTYLQTEEDLATRKIDPNRLNSRLRAVKIGNMLGNVFGTIAAASLGQTGSTYAATAARNIAMVEGEIARDIDAQRKEIDMISRRGKAVQNGLAMMRSRHTDERAAEAALLAHKWSDVERRMKTKAAEIGIEGSNANLQTMLAEVATKQADAQQQLKAITNENAMRAIGSEADMLSREAQLQTAGMAARLEAFKAQHGDKLKAREIIDIQASDVAASAIDTLYNTFNRSLDWGSGVAQFLPGTDATIYIDQRNMAAQLIGQILNKGPMTDEDMDRMRSFLPAAGDSKKRAAAKYNFITQLLNTGKTVSVRALEKAGFDVSPLKQEGEQGQQARMPSTFQPAPR